VFTVNQSISQAQYCRNALATEELARRLEAESVFVAAEITRFRESEAVFAAEELKRRIGGESGSAQLVTAESSTKMGKESAQRCTSTH